MATRLKGKWAQGIQPRNFSWVIKDKLAICERPGGYAANHRRADGDRRYRKAYQPSTRAPRPLIHHAGRRALRQRFADVGRSDD